MVLGVFGVQPETLPFLGGWLTAGDVSARLNAEKMYANGLKVYPNTEL